MGFFDALKRMFNYPYNFINEYDSKEALLYIKRSKVLLKEIDKVERKAFENEFLNLVEDSISKKHRNLREDEIKDLVQRMRLMVNSRKKGDVYITSSERINEISAELKSIQKSINANDQNFDINKIYKMVLKTKALISKNESDSSLYNLIQLFDQIEIIFNEISSFKRNGINTNLSRKIDALVRNITQSNQPRRRAA